MARARLGDKDSNLDKRSQNPTQDQRFSTIPQDSAAPQDGMGRDAVQSAGAPPRSAAASEPTEEDLERCILDAVRMGLADVARTLAARLDERWRARGGKVIDIRRGRGGK
jgi:hypothetical protein